MKRVAVLGGGPAGAFAAERLAKAGIRTILFDEKLAWEKPCGGGLTYKAYNQYPFLIENGTSKKLVTQTCLATANAGEAPLTLTHPLVIYSRLELNRMLLNRAAAAGAEIEKTRVLALSRAGHGWSLRTQSGIVDADFCVIATGARNPLRAVGTEWTAADTMVAMGYYVPVEQAHIDIQFFADLEGYIWVFPRQGHLSVGICGKGTSARDLRERLDGYMKRKGLPTAGSTFFGHVLPSLETASWQGNRVAGDGWIAAGDAAGLVDPITGEGLYYAVRSADLAAGILLSSERTPAQYADAYRTLLQREFTDDLEFAARIAKRLFLGRFLCGSVPARMIQLLRKSPCFRDLVEDLFAGTQNYLDLKSRLIRNINGTVHDVLMNLFLTKLVPGQNRA